MKRVGILILLLGGFAAGQQTTANITPAATGQKLGSVNQRWDAFIHNLDVSGTITAPSVNGVITVQGLPGTPGIGLSAASDIPFTGNNIFTGSSLFRQPPAGLVNTAGWNTFGDSITCGAWAQTIPAVGCSTSGWANMLATDLWASPFNVVGACGSSPNGCNYARSGDQMCDLARVQVYPNVNPQTTGNPNFGAMAGQNDQHFRGAVTGHDQSFKACLMAVDTWLTIPRSAKLFGQDAGVTKTGTWSNDNTVLAGLGTQSTTNGDSLSFTVTTSLGAPIYIGYRVIDGNGGTASVTIDGANQGTLNGFGYDAINTINGTTDSIFVNRFPVLTNGAHTVTLTVTSATGAGNIFSFLWAGTWVAPATVGFPRVFNGGVTREQNDTNATLTAAYDGYVQSVVSQLSSDGLWVNFVPVRNYVNATTDMQNQQHPNQVGHQHLRDAFRFVMQPVGMAAVMPTNVPSFDVNNTLTAPGSTFGWWNRADASMTHFINCGATTAQICNFQWQSVGVAKWTAQNDASNIWRLIDVADSSRSRLLVQTASSTTINSGGTGGIFFNSSSNSGTGGVSFASGGASPAVNATISAAGKITGALYASNTNCSSAGGTCVAAPSGSVSIAAAATTVTVATTAVTANSQILLTRDNSLGTKLAVTCNTQSSLVLGTPYVSARTAATSFVVTLDVAPTTNPLCLSYTIVN